jgi:hypothetical protein
MMKLSMTRSLLAAGCACAALLAGGCSNNDEVTTWHESGAMQDDFGVDRAKLTSTGTGKYWSLQPGRRMVYRSPDGDALVITVLHRTVEVDGVTARVVEEREESKGAIKEISLNYFAADPKTGDLYYFGEDVDIYKNGTVAGHEGAWRAGVNGAKFGLAVPGTPKVGQKYYQEVAPGVAMDRAEVVSVSGRQTVKAGQWDNCLLVRESTPLEKDVEEKWYAPGVGLIRDGDLELVGMFDE